MLFKAIKSEIKLSLQSIRDKMFNYCTCW